MDIAEYFETIFKAEVEESTENYMAVSMQISLATSILTEYFMNLQKVTESNKYSNWRSGESWTTKKKATKITNDFQSFSIFQIFHMKRALYRYQCIIVHSSTA